MTLLELLEKINVTKAEDIKLFFVTRAIKEGLTRNSRTRDKYLFKVYQVDSSEEIRQHLFESTQSQIDNIIGKNYEMVDYDILSDETDHLFTYAIKDKAFSFSDVVTNQLLKPATKIKTISEITTENEELWAYSVGFEDLTDNKWIYTFRKIQSGKVAVNEIDNPDSNFFKKCIRTVFNTESMKLEVLKGESITLDKRIDCVFYDDTFYVVQKGAFEQIVGLQEEYQEQAKVIVRNMQQIPLITGTDKLMDLIEKKPSLHKKLVKIERIGGYKQLNAASIKQMSKVCKQYGEKLPMKEGKLNMETEQDIDVILKMFGDYYKKGVVSGKSYGTFSGKEIEVANI